MAAGETQDNSIGESQPSPRAIWAWVAPVVLVGLVLGGVALWRGGSPGLASKGQLSPIGEVPDFTLTNRDGSTVSKADLLGKVWVADFIFTRCVDACPLLSGQMATLQRRFADDADLRLVSITLDPVYDTPEVLTAYASNFKADPQRWLFLTGEKDAIFRLSRDGFRLGVFDPSNARQTSAVDRVPSFRQAAVNVWRWLGPSLALAHHGQHGPDGDPQQAIQHSGRLVLVDRQGQIRQYYHSQDDDILPRLNRDLTTILREP